MITGMSGAGKTLALRHFEDMGYFCVDNLPPALVPTFAELCSQSSGAIKHVAVVMDVRGGEFFDSFSEAIGYLKENRYNYQILFLDASEEVLVRRYKENRRQHPLSEEGNVLEGIRIERQRLDELRQQADLVLDTSSLSAQEHRAQLKAYFQSPGWRNSFSIRLISFGFKYGLPLDADLVFDVRFLPNPYYLPELRSLPGTSEAVSSYVFKWSVTREFLKRLTRLLEWLIPHYIKEGKTSLVVAIGCTGGRHRSVALAVRLREALQAKYEVFLEHRDVGLETEGD